MRSFAPRCTLWCSVYPGLACNLIPSKETPFFFQPDMPDILFHYERVNPTSWAYLSSLLTLALYFKFNRIWSVRNFDLFLLIMLSPGLLLVQWAWENAGTQPNATEIEHYGFLWLFATGSIILLRLLMDPAMVRRPLLDPNLNPAGLLFLSGSLLFFLMANVVTGKPSPDDLSPARKAETVREDGQVESSTALENSFATDGPGFWLLYRQPRILTQQLIGSAANAGAESSDQSMEHEMMIRQATARVMAILSACDDRAWDDSSSAIVHFDKHFGRNWCCGSLSTFALHCIVDRQCPNTPCRHRFWCGRLSFIAARLLSGMMIGLASGTIYYPAFLLPLWCSFYWDRGIKRFVTGVIVMIVVLVISMAFTSTSLR